MDEDIVIKLSKLIEEGHDVVFAMIVEQKGSSPRRNASMLIDNNGEIIAGTIGGGAIEKRATEDALKCLKNGENKLILYHLAMNSNSPNTVPMACGGDISIYYKVYGSKPRIIAIGAGHISSSLYRLSQFLGYRYAVVDDRAELANFDRFPNADFIIADDVVESLKKLETNSNDAFVIISYDHMHDMQALIALKDKPSFYIGMIGSKRKVAYTFREIENQKVDIDREKIHAPIGLAIGGETPDEIALSIMSEIQSIRYKKNRREL